MLETTEPTEEQRTYHVYRRVLLMLAVILILAALSSVVPNSVARMNRVTKLTAPPLKELKNLCRRVLRDQLNESVKDGRRPATLWDAVKFSPNGMFDDAILFSIDEKSKKIVSLGNVKQKKTALDGIYYTAQEEPEIEELPSNRNKLKISLTKTVNAIADIKKCRVEQVYVKSEPSTNPVTVLGDACWHKAKCKRSQHWCRYDGTKQHCPAHWTGIEDTVCGSSDVLRAQLSCWDASYRCNEVYRTIWSCNDFKHRGNSCPMLGDSNCQNTLNVNLRSSLAKTGDTIDKIVEVGVLPLLTKALPSYIGKPLDFVLQMTKEFSNTPDPLVGAVKDMEHAIGQLHGCIHETLAKEAEGALEDDWKLLEQRMDPRSVSLRDKDAQYRTSRNHFDVSTCEKMGIFYENNQPGNVDYSWQKGMGLIPTGLESVQLCSLLFACKVSDMRAIGNDADYAVWLEKITLMMKQTMESVDKWINAVKQPLLTESRCGYFNDDIRLVDTTLNGYRATVLGQSLKVALPFLKVFDITSEGEYCPRVCERAELIPLETDNWSHHDRPPFHFCSANYGGNGFRGGYNLGHHDYHGKCVVGYGAKEEWTGAFRCACVPPGTKLKEVTVTNGAQECPAACGTATPAYETGKYGSQPFYACTANWGDGYRGGYQLAGWKSCTAGYGGKEKGLTTFKCLCLEHKKSHNLGPQLRQRTDENVPMRANDYLQSINSKYIAKMQTDGNFVLYRVSDMHAFWATHTHGKSGALAVLQPDKNFVLYLGTRPIWDSATYGSGTAPVGLIMQDDGNLVMYDKNGHVLWATHTWWISQQ